MIIFSLEDNIAAAYATVQAQAETAATLGQPIGALLESTGAIDAIESGVRHLAEGVPVLMKALDAASQAHPFIAGELLKLLHDGHC
jgi:hypothetical protein